MYTGIESIVAIRGRDYKLEAVYHEASDAFLWVAYRSTPWSGWEKMPSWARGDINRFPRSVAATGRELVESLNEQL